MSVFVSRKTQRFYVRQGYMPVFEGPVTIQDADKPIGSYVFTAFDHTDSRVRWGIVSMYCRRAPKAWCATRRASSSRKGEARRISRQHRRRRRRRQAHPRPHRHPARDA